MIQIIGAGAIGCLWLAKLQQSNFACHIVTRTKHQTTELQFTNLQAEKIRLPISHSHQLLHNTLIEQQSVILVCVKAPNVLSALLMQRPYISTQQPIILMHNGYGCADEILKHFPNNPIISATTANASLLNAPFNITQTGNGASYFGTFNCENKKLDLATLIKPFQAVMKDVHWCNDIAEKCWLKLIINAAINPLTAIHQIKNGALQASEFSLTIKAIIEESLAIAKAEQFNFELLSLQKSINAVIEATAPNYSSMNRDIFYRRETEIEFINGYLIKKAHQHNIEAPILTNLYQQIKALEYRSPTVVNNC
ncbi:2-dehydropantoate 2-reductase [Psychromonas sp. RZ22]|uniref:ketopantoate reductase family protein n=1 Tax=Psychromonas algarum TaxID=2555643 RepID=UPI0010675BCE|nr:2-dehydropantoate 2-reductase [Psychromonas sp. RZ22]TEW56042.1 2-dehydropantoate 2-reductase [Psychromonas sp. RZ22]